MTGRTEAPEDLNLNNIVAREFPRAAEAMDPPEGMPRSSRACKAIYYIQFPVEFGDNYQSFYAWRAEHSHHREPLKEGGISWNPRNHLHEQIEKTARAYGRIREVLLTRDRVKEMRTAGYRVAIEKIARSPLELGVFS